jgi:hypothetical protein
VRLKIKTTGRAANFLPILPKLKQDKLLYYLPPVAGLDFYTLGLPDLRGLLFA